MFPERPVSEDLLADRLGGKRPKWDSRRPKDPDLKWLQTRESWPKCRPNRLQLIYRDPGAPGRKLGRIFASNVRLCGTIPGAVRLHRGGKPLEFGHASSSRFPCYADSPGAQCTEKLFHHPLGMKCEPMANAQK
ncbi:hypothetical protein QAD02_019569 [Eretmocerus hayati]|uniref:Uncharacterized protein n=1 Tax=Eretmocerus hayati TaxID=131215 RepID=A0ACC2PJY1_9HYME|nr:hypothetical protein QAD02_019569 [Eretmocerus hayati]